MVTPGIHAVHLHVKHVPTRTTSRMPNWMRGLWHGEGPNTPCPVNPRIDRGVFANILGIIIR